MVRGHHPHHELPRKLANASPVAVAIKDDIIAAHQSFCAEHGEVVELKLPVIDRRWLARWYKACGVSSRRANLVYKVSRTKLVACLRVCLAEWHPHPDARGGDLHNDTPRAVRLLRPEALMIL